MEGEKSQAKPREALNQAEQIVIGYYIPAQFKPQKQKDGLIPHQTSHWAERTHQDQKDLLSESRSEGWNERIQEDC